MNMIMNMNGFNFNNMNSLNMNNPICNSLPNPKLILFQNQLNQMQINQINKMNQQNQMNQMMSNMNMNINNSNFNINSKYNNEKLSQIVSLETVMPIHPCKDKYNDKQYQIITDICINAIKDNNIDRKDIAIYCAEKIKMKLKGQWFVLIQNINEQNFDFRFSTIKFDDLIIFKYKENYIYVSQLIKNK